MIVFLPNTPQQRQAVVVIPQRVARDWRTGEKASESLSGDGPIIGCIRVKKHCHYPCIFSNSIASDKFANYLMSNSLISDYRMQMSV
jgi:hypothetical protein